MNSVGKCLTSQAGIGLRMEQSSTILVYSVQNLEILCGLSKSQVILL